MPIEENLAGVLKTIPNHVSLVAVSKTKPIEDIMAAYHQGQRIFGENRVQEMTEKWEKMPKDIQWHMIGHLQRNKVKYMAHYVSLIHGVDSPRLLKEINKQAQKCNRVISCLLQVHIAKEETKFGFNEDELFTFLNSKEFQSYTYIKVEGLMGMATFTDDQKRVAKEFSYLKSLFDRIKENHLNVSVLSMGMSGDYKIAMQEGSNMVRIGSSIFGARN